MLKHFTPNAYFIGIADIDIEKLKAEKVEVLLLDVDNTITTWNNPDVEPHVLEWFAELNKSGIKGCILSNNSAQRLIGISDMLEIDFFPKAKKPRAIGYEAAIKKMGSTKENTVMVGDQLMTDIFGANNAGIKSILLKPISLAAEFKWTKVNRFLEKFIIKSVLKKVEKSTFLK